jgi:lysyl-tRNA synthetase class 1
MSNQLQSPHWADQVATAILEWQKKQGIKKLHVDDMKTPSGRVHTGALRGVVLHDIVTRALAAQTTQPVTSTYVFNDMDAMDSLPSYLPKEKYEQHMGKPLYRIPAPSLDESGIDFSLATEEERQLFRQAKNFAEFYALDFIEAFRKLGCEQEVVWSHELYESGLMDEQIRAALDSVEIMREIYKEVADYKLPEKWHPFQVFCENCGKVGSTLVTAWDGQKVTYECQPNKVTWAVGCGHTGQVSPFGGTGKLLWKVDWPAHWKTLGVTIEGAGKDHTSSGGSRDMARAECERVFHIPEPYDIPYEWILIRGAKMSSSKGVGTSAREFVKLFPQEVGRFLFLNKHYNQVIDFDPQTLSIPDLFDDYDRGARIFWQQEAGDQRLARAFELSQVSEVSQPHYLPRFLDVAVWMQYPEINLEEKVAEQKGSSLNELERHVLQQRREYAEFWIKRYAPEEYSFRPRQTLPESAQKLSSDQRAFLKEINDLIESQSWEPAELQQKIFELAKAGIGPRPAFEAIYQAFLGKKAGPRAAWFLLSIEKNLRDRRIQELSENTSINQSAYLLENISRPELITLNPAYLTQYPSTTVGVAIIRGITIVKSLPELEVAKAEVLAELEGLTTETLGKYPEILSYRKMYKEMGIDWHSRRPSPEALLRRVAQGKELYTVNSCVDAYNLAVMRNRISVGAFELSAVQFPTELKVADGGEQIHLLGDTEPTTLKAGEVSYFDQTGPYNLDFNYRDAQRTMVTYQTTDLWINVEGVHEITRTQVEKTLQETLELIQKYCGGTVEVAGIVTS